MPRAVRDIDALPALDPRLRPAPTSPRRRCRVPDDLTQLAATQFGLVSRRQCYAAGLGRDTLRRLLAQGSWLEVTRDVYLVDRDAVQADDWPNRLRQRALVAMLVGGEDAIAVGLTALVLDGVQGAPLHFTPQFVVSGRRPKPPRAVSHRRLTPNREVHALLGPATKTCPGGWRVAATPWALAQGLPDLDREHAVSVMDSALQLRRVTAGGLDRVVTALARRRGVRALRRWLALVDPRSESPLETRARLQCLDHGVPPDELQREFYDAFGRFVARCDMVWDLGGGRMLIVEMDGGHHRRNGQIDRDNARDNRLTALGHVVVHFGWEHLASGEIWRRVQEELRRAGIAA